MYSAGTLEEAETYLNQSVNLVILDINLPDGDGREFLKKVRGNNPVPVLLLTARDTEQDMLQGFAVGCDDYVTKPFSMAVLLCRIEVLLKHVGNMEGESFVKLTATEIRLLEVFLKHRNQVLTREQLLGLVWDAYENYVDEKTLNVNIRRLREKIEDDPKEPVYIKTVFGIGYKWSDKV